MENVDIIEAAKAMTCALTDDLITAKNKVQSDIEQERFSINKAPFVSAYNSIQTELNRRDK